MLVEQQNSDGSFGGTSTISKPRKSPATGELARWIAAQNREGSSPYPDGRTHPETKEDYTDPGGGRTWTAGADWATSPGSRLDAGLLVGPELAVAQRQLRGIGTGAGPGRSRVLDPTYKGYWKASDIPKTQIATKAASTGTTIGTKALNVLKSVGKVAAKAFIPLDLALSADTIAHSMSSTGGKERIEKDSDIRIPSVWNVLSNKTPLTYVLPDALKSNPDAHYNVQNIARSVVTDFNPYTADPAARQMGKHHDDATIANSRSAKEYRRKVRETKGDYALTPDGNAHRERLITKPERGVGKRVSDWMSGLFEEKQQLDEFAPATLAIGAIGTALDSAMKNPLAAAGAGPVALGYGIGKLIGADSTEMSDRRKRRNLIKSINRYRPDKFSNQTWSFGSDRKKVSINDMSVAELETVKKHTDEQYTERGAAKDAKDKEQRDTNQAAWEKKRSAKDTEQTGGARHAGEGWANWRNTPHGYDYYPPGHQGDDEHRKSRSILSPRQYDTLQDKAKGGENLTDEEFADSLAYKDAMDKEYYDEKQRKRDAGTDEHTIAANKHRESLGLPSQTPAEAEESLSKFRAKKKARIDSSSSVIKSRGQWAKKYPDSPDAERHVAAWDAQRAEKDAQSLTNLNKDVKQTRQSLEQDDLSDEDRQKAETKVAAYDKAQDVVKGIASAFLNKNKQKAEPVSEQYNPKSLLPFASVYFNPDLEKADPTLDKMHRLHVLYANTAHPHNEAYEKGFMHKYDRGGDVVDAHRAGVKRIGTIGTQLRLKFKPTNNAPE